LAALAAAAVLHAQSERAPDKGDAKHGEYLVHRVAMCIQCHTPRDEDGNLNMHELLRGEAVPISSPFPGVRFAARAPHIAGLPGYTHDNAIRLLTEGINARGRTPLPPMPPFRMSPQDAEDVVAYLKSID
jgi:mono/diheme cytochrome c family protein